MVYFAMGYIISNFSTTRHTYLSLMKKLAKSTLLYSAIWSQTARAGQNPTTSFNFKFSSYIPDELRKLVKKIHTVSHEDLNYPLFIENILKKQNAVCLLNKASSHKTIPLNGQVQYFILVSYNRSQHLNNRICLLHIHINIVFIKKAKKKYVKKIFGKRMLEQAKTSPFDEIPHTVHSK